MSFDPSVSVGLSPCFVGSDIPFARLLFEFKKAGLDRQACHAILASMIASGQVPEGCFEPDAILEGGRPATDRVLFPTTSEWRLIFEDLAAPDRRAAGVVFEEEMVPAVAEFVRRAARGEDLAALRGEFGALGDRFFDGFLSQRQASALPRWPAADAPGIHRREHASLVICSSTTRVLLDPIRLMAERLPKLGAAPALDDGERFDAILVSHPHLDHWHLPSLLAVASEEDTLVVVPRVPTPNLLTPEPFIRSLELAGLRGADPEWGSTISVGDIEIDVLPFYGEQPTRHPPGPEPALRSFGNCYRVNTPDFSALILIDAGADPAGDMIDVLAGSCARRGPVDVILGSTRELLSPFFGGLQHYWATLPFAELERLWRVHQAGGLASTTAGPDGTPALCGAARARYHLPYANGFNGVGQPIVDVGWGLGEPSEAELRELVHAGLRARGIATEALAWSPGDSVHFVDGRIEQRSLRGI